MKQSTYDDTGTQTSTDELTVSERCRVLSAARRRTTLDVISNQAAPLELTDLAVAVATREFDGDAPDEGTIEQVAISLHHVHLPLLADLGIIDYVPETNRVEACHVSADSLLN